MAEPNSKIINQFGKFLNSLAIDLTRFYYKKLNKHFIVNNKSKGSRYDPVTSAHRSFEKFIRSKIIINFQNTRLLEKSLDIKKPKMIILGLSILSMELDHL